MLFDTHAHLDQGDFDNDRDEVIALANAQDPMLVRLGGGCTGLESRLLPPEQTGEGIRRDILYAIHRVNDLSDDASLIINKNFRPQESLFFESVYRVYTSAISGLLGVVVIPTSRRVGP